MTNYQRRNLKKQLWQKNLYPFSNYSVGKKTKDKNTKWTNYIKTRTGITHPQLNKINSKIRFIQNYKLDKQKIKWFGSYYLEELYTLYLIHKYKSNICLDIHLANFADAPQTDQIAYLSILKCIRENKDNQPIVCVRLTWIDEDHNKHANLLIYRTEHKTIELFEPHGSVYLSGTYDAFIRSKMNQLLSLAHSTIDPSIQYLHSDLICPIMNGLQKQENVVQVKIGIVCYGYNLYLK